MSFFPYSITPLLSGAWRRENGELIFNGFNGFRFGKMRRFCRWIVVMVTQQSVNILNATKL